MPTAPLPLGPSNAPRKENEVARKQTFETALSTLEARIKTWWDRQPKQDDEGKALEAPADYVATLEAISQAQALVEELRSRDGMLDALSELDPEYGPERQLQGEAIFEIAGRMTAIERCIVQYEASTVTTI
jgi:hypothetical protein